MAEIDNASFAMEGDQALYAEFGTFLNDEGRLLPFGDGKRDGDIDGEFAIDTLGLFDLYPKPVMLNLYDPYKILNPFTIKKRNLAAYGSPFHVQNVVGFLAIDPHFVVVRRKRYVETVLMHGIYF